jgi:hypothetical protein
MRRQPIVENSPMRNLPVLFLPPASYFFGELEKRLSNWAEAKGVAVEVTLLRSVWIGRNGQGRHLDISLGRANLKVSCATQDGYTHALCVSRQLEINGVPTNAKILNPDILD